MNQDNNFTPVDPNMMNNPNSGVPVMNPTPVVEMPAVANPIPAAPVVETPVTVTSMPEVPVIENTIVNPAPVQSEVVFMSNPVDSTATGVPVGDNTGIPEAPSAPVEPVAPAPIVVDNSTVVAPVAPTVEAAPAQAPAPQTTTHEAVNSALNASEDEDLLRAFIGKNFTKITSGGFNVPAFFFTSFYMYYRKMFLYGVLYFLASTILTSLVGPVALAGSIACGIFMNKLYVRHANKEIGIIKAANPSADKQTLVELCSKKGGTSGGQLALGILLQCGLAIVAVIVLFFVVGAAFITTLLGMPDISVTVPDVSGGEFNGMILHDTSFVPDEKFNFSLPSEFIKVDGDSYNVEYNYLDGETRFPDCSLSVYSPKGYDSSNTLLTQMMTYYSVPGSLEKVNINGAEWNMYSTDDSFDTKYVYGLDLDGKVVLMEYEISKNSINQTSCEAYKDTVVNSVSLK